MERRGKSKERSRSGVRKHKKINGRLDKDSDDESSFISSNSIKQRKKYTIAFKKECMKKYFDIVEKNLKSGYFSITNEFDTPRNCLKEWVREFKFLENVTGRNHKFRLEGAGRLPDTLDIEDELFTWVEEQAVFKSELLQMKLFFKHKN